jgi:F0F1-type ATP synthase membrane subunit b/b'
MNALELLAMWSQIGAAVLFLVLAVVIYNRFMAPGVKHYTEAKNAEIRAAESHRERMRAAFAAAQTDLERAESDAREIRSRLQVVVAREREHALTLANAEAERIVRNAHGELERQRLAARDRLRVDLIEKALAKARAEAGQRVDTATNTRLVEATLNDLTRGRA